MRLRHSLCLAALLHLGAALAGTDINQAREGIGPATAARLSDNGLTVNGAPYAAPQTAPPARTDSRD